MTADLIRTISPTGRRYLLALHRWDPDSNYAHPEGHPAARDALAARRLIVRDHPYTYQGTITYADQLTDLGRRIAQELTDG